MAQEEPHNFFEGLAQPKSYIPTDALEPEHAEVRLRLDFAPGGPDMLRGWMVLDVAVRRATSSVVLHGHRLLIQSCHVQSAAGDSPIACQSWDVDDALQKIVFHLERPVPRGRAAVHLAWSVNVSEVPARAGGQWGGLFVRHEGPGRFHHITQFEPCNARTAYPCFDQPCTKQTFRLSLTHVPAGLTALSNTEIERVETDPADPGFKSVTFARTQPTPAYLTAWVVGSFRVWEKVLRLPDYGNNSAATGLFRNVTARVLVPEDLADGTAAEGNGRASDGTYALELVSAALEFFTGQFRVNYPYDRLDNVSTPLHPLLGMENWGLITYHAGYLEVNGHTSSDRRKRIARLVGHEVVHQWFGNSTSVSWWSFLFLKEGFARLLEYVFVDQLRPEWNYWHHFQSDIYTLVLLLDEKARSHPIMRPIDYPADIFANVDTICYAKGAAVLRMLWAFLEAPVFFRGLQIYLRRHCNQCVAPSALWNAFSDAYRELHPRSPTKSINVAELVQHWVECAGHPVLHVFRDPATRAIQVEQRLAGRGKVESSVPRDSDGRTLWKVPIVSRSGPRGREHRFVLSHGKMHLADLDEEGPVLFNAGAAGFYRVKYDESLLEQLLDGGGLVWMSELELSSLFQDTLHFALSGKSELSAPLIVRLTQLVLENVQSHYLWQIVLPHVIRLLEELEGTDALGHVCVAIREPINRMYGMLPTEFVERGHMHLLEEVLVRVSAALDPWVLRLQSSAEEALMQLAREGDALTDDQRAPLLTVIGLWLRCPDCAPEAAASVTALLEDSACPVTIVAPLKKLLWGCASLEVLRKLLEPLETAEELGQVLEQQRSAKGIRRLCRAVRECCARRKMPAVEFATAIDDGPGANLRTAFRGFRYRRPTLSSSRSAGGFNARTSGSISIDSAAAAGGAAGKEEGDMSYLPLQQYLMLGAVVLGGIAVGAVAYKMWSTGNQGQQE